MKVARRKNRGHTLRKLLHIKQNIFKPDPGHDGNKVIYNDNRSGNCVYFTNNEIQLKVMSILYERRWLAHSCYEKRKEKM
jgi:hypothetical protein